jgi:hypothetical protein
MDLFKPTDSEQAISTATAVLAWMERPLHRHRCKSSSLPGRDRGLHQRD